MVLAFKTKREQARVRSCLLKSQGRLASDYKSARQKQNKGNQSREKDKRTTTTKNPTRKPNRQVVCAEARKEGSRNGKDYDRLYLDMCFGFLGVVGLKGKWMVLKKLCVCGRNGPLAIHHGSVFDSPNACSWAASSIIHGYRRPGRSRAFYFSRVNNSCPLTQPRESRNRGTDKQGSRWLVEPFRTSALFWFGSQRGSLHAHGPGRLPRRGRQGQLVYAGGLSTRAFWSVNISLGNKCRTLLRIKCTFTTMCKK